MRDAMDALNILAACGLLGRTWPDERVLVGLRVCKWLQRVLFCHMERVEVVGGQGMTLATATLNRVGAGSYLKFTLDAEVIDRGGGWRKKEGSRACRSFLSGLFRAVRGPFGTSLVHLDLGQNRIDAEDTVMLGNALFVCPVLTHLHLADNTIGKSGVSPPGDDSLGLQNLAASLPTLPACKVLAYLDCSRNRIGVDGAQYLAQALEGCTALTHLNLSGNHFELAGAVRLAESLWACTRMEHLDLCYNAGGSRGATSLACTLPQMRKLTHLNLSNSDVGDEGVQQISSALQHCPLLSSLNLVDNNVGEDGVRALVDVLACCTCLEHLSLCENYLEDGDAGGLLARGVETRSTLTRLDLSESGIGAAQIDRLAGALAKCGLLQHLNLGHNEVGPVGARSLAGALVSCSKLTYLGLDGNGLSNAGVTELAAALKACVCLTHLELSFNDWGVCGAEALAEALPACSGLTHLGGGGNLLEDAGSRSLGEALRVCPELTSLLVDGCAISALDASLPRMLGAASALKTLDLSHNFIADAGAGQPAMRLVGSE